MANEIAPGAIEFRLRTPRLGQVTVGTGAFDLVSQGVDARRAHVRRRALYQMRRGPERIQIALCDGFLEPGKIVRRIADEHLHQRFGQHLVAHHQLEEVGMVERLFFRRLGWRWRRRYGSGRRLGIQPAFKAGGQRLDHDRLGQVVVHPRVQALLPVTAERVRGHRHDRAAQPATAQLPRCFVAVHARHLAVHQDQVIVRLRGPINGLDAVTRLIELRVAKLGQHTAHHHHVDGVVFDDQQALLALPRGIARTAAGLGRDDGRFGRTFAEGLLQSLTQGRPTDRFVQEQSRPGAFEWRRLTAKTGCQTTDQHRARSLQGINR